jgi:hypothetical protein
MAFNAAFMGKKDPICPATIVLIISYYRLEGQELLWLCIHNCGSQSYCGSGSTCASSYQGIGFAYGWCTDGYLSLTILFLVPIVTSRVIVVKTMALALDSSVITS